VLLDDGNADIVTANLDTSDLSLLAGDGTGNFALAVSPPTDAGPVVVAAGDVRGNDTIDLVTVNRTAQTASVLIGEGGRNFAAPANYDLSARSPPSRGTSSFLSSRAQGSRGVPAS
jgi:hypothetical protein